MRRLPKLVILVGNIGTGKSTLAKAYAKKGYLCVSRDSLRYMIGGGTYVFDPERTEPLVFRMELALLRTLMFARVDVLVDDVVISRKLRKRYLNYAKEYDYYVVADVLPRLPKEVCVSRRLQNSHGNQPREVWEQIWERFNSAYESPTKREGFDKIIRRTK